ncbi:MAG: class III extradiol ring-cleavage dioxygenase [Methanobacteriota archaeon]
MSNPLLPTLFLSHGVPTLPLDSIPARDFLLHLGSRYQNIRAVLCISAHWNTPYAAVNAGKMPETIYDFYGFPTELYQIRYPAVGSPVMAGKTVDLIHQAGIRCDINSHRGLDHGAWIPLMLMFPDADIPIVQLSIQHHLDPAEHLALGKSIQSLRNDGVLIIGSGGAVHPLGYADTSLGVGAKTDEWAKMFDSWLMHAVTAGDRESLLYYKERAPYPERAHPYPDHFMPLFVAMGAAGEGATGIVLHQSWQWGDLSMGMYEFR